MCDFILKHYIQRKFAEIQEIPVQSLRNSEIVSVFLYTVENQWLFFFFLGTHREFLWSPELTSFFFPQFLSVGS